MTENNFECTYKHYSDEGISDDFVFKDENIEIELEDGKMVIFVGNGDQRAVFEGYLRTFEEIIILPHSTKNMK
jgi:hypothetical protein